MKKKIQWKFKIKNIVSYIFKTINHKINILDNFYKNNLFIFEQ